MCVISILSNGKKRFKQKMTYKYYIICITFLCICPFERLYGQEKEAEQGNSNSVALKSNLLYDAALVPNIGVEISMQEGFSIEVSYMGAWWKNKRRHYYWQCYGGDMSIKKYWGGKKKNPLTGHFVGMYFQLLTYDFEFGGTGYQSKRTNNSGIEYGYSIPVGEHANLVLSMGVGYLEGETKKYKPMDSHYVHQSTSKLSFFGPTKAEISISWFFKRTRK